VTQKFEALEMALYNCKLNLHIPTITLEFDDGIADSVAKVRESHVNLSTKWLGFF
jgi:hypothetical protein